jgi:hypothetical protein
MKAKVGQQLMKLRIGLSDTRLRMESWKHTARESWKEFLREAVEVVEEIRKVNWPREAVLLFDRLSNSAHAYLTASFILGSVVMLFTGVETGLMVVALMVIPVAMLMLAVRLYTRMADDRVCEEHFTALIETCTSSWEQSGSFREHLVSLLDYLEEAHLKMASGENRLREAYERHYAKNQKRLQAQILMVFGFPVSVVELQGVACAFTRLMTVSEKLRQCWEREHGPYVRGQQLRMEQFLWLMRRMPEIYDLR